MMLARGFLWAAAVMMVMVVSGCGAKGHPVGGTVRVKGGDVVKQGTVQFISSANNVSGVIGQDGKYQLVGAEGGTPPGTYKVIFMSTEVGGGYDNPDEPARQMIDSKYVNPTTTPIEVTVPGGSYDFELDPPAGGAGG